MSTSTPQKTSTVLEKILKAKREEVGALRSESFPKRLRRSPASLIKALKAPGPGFIFEYKKASPGKGDIRPGAEVKDIQEIYEPFANAISVLTDGPFFQGSIDDLRAMGELTNLPILAKDFFIDEAQVERAHSAGADAILLMLSVLDNDGYKRLAKKADDLGLDVLTEVHDKDEMERANALGAAIIGINNRNLKTLEIDLATTDDLVPLARKGAVLVSESGFENRHQVLSFNRRVDGFLIGSAVMGARQPDLKIREFVFGKVKICGFTKPEDARLAYENGAFYGGLNFVENTPRFIDPGRAEEIISEAPMKWVGVFRNAIPSYIAAVAKFLALDAIQLHGVETDKFREKLQKLLPEGTEIWQAVEGPKYSPEEEPEACSRVLLDSKHHRVFGGTGHVFGWGSLKHLENKDHLGLAGGLNPGNVKNAVKTGIPLLDVCSGVEQTRSVKSPEKIKGFFKAIRHFEGPYHG